MSKADDAVSLVQLTLDKVMDAQQSRARENVKRLRRVHPGDTPQQLIRRLDRSYLTRITVSGGTSGVAAVVPGVRIPTVLPGAVAFTDASAFYLLSLAEVHGLHREDIEQRRRLLATVLLGGGVARGLDKVIEHVGPYYGRRIVHATPMSAINRANKMLRPQFITKYGTKRGVFVLSEMVPLGIGVALGAGGHLALGWPTIRSARAFLGQPPSSWGGDDRGDGMPLDPGSGDSAP
ncbi:hypothetical protein ABZ467_18180 [Streptomyces sp. NPDC005727]|uniref:hypothetical protein n=1 Tax=Streptomyces sp. NPDC005727 TaxID=3157053 RepID=UPI0033D17BD1